MFRRVTIQGTRDCVPDEHGVFYRVGDEGEIRGGGLDYASAAMWRTPDCTPGGIGLTVSRVIGTAPGSYRLASCAARPDTGPPQFDAAYRPTSPEHELRHRGPDPRAATTGHACQLRRHRTRAALYA